MGICVSGRERWEEKKREKREEGWNYTCRVGEVPKTGEALGER